MQKTEESFSSIVHKLNHASGESTWLDQLIHIEYFTSPYYCQFHGTLQSGAWNHCQQLWLFVSNSQSFHKRNNNLFDVLQTTRTDKQVRSSKDLNCISTTETKKSWLETACVVVVVKLTYNASFLVSVKFRLTNLARHHHNQLYTFKWVICTHNTCSKLYSRDAKAVNHNTIK